MRFAILIGLTAMLSVAQTPRVIAVSGGSYIGVGMQEVDSERAKALKLHDESGVEVTVVQEDSPAEKAGLKVGDVLLRYNGQKVEGNEQFARLVRETPPGRDVKIDISRGGVMQTVMVRVALRKAQKIEWSDGTPMGASWPVEINIPDMPRPFTMSRGIILGIEADPIDGQLAQYFGVKDGVLVRSVAKGSAVEKAGIRAGDVIVRIQDARIASPVDISNQVRSLRGKSAPVVVMRDHKEVTLTVAIGNEDIPGRIQFTPFQVPNQP